MVMVHGPDVTTDTCNRPGKAPSSHVTTTSCWQWRETFKLTSKSGEELWLKWREVLLFYWKTVLCHGISFSGQRFDTGKKQSISWQWGSHHNVHWSYWGVAHTFIPISVNHILLSSEPYLLVEAPRQSLFSWPQNWLQPRSDLLSETILKHLTFKKTFNFPSNWGEKHSLIQLKLIKPDPLWFMQKC